MRRIEVVVGCAATGPGALLDRERELAALTGAVDAAAGGHGGVVWIEGPAGIGKTTLLQAAGAHAGEVGLRVLRARPGLLEREFAFGVVCGLFEPAVVERPAGLQLAHDCGAVSLVGMTLTELATAGVHPRRPAVTGPDALTPAERRIAERAASGRSNREIAQTLFITPKTVENHLGSVYRKLGVTGRTELAGALTRTARA